MHKIISPTQSTFIRGRNIFESILACIELVHTMKKSRSGSFIFKVDFEKAFDCVKWDFLLEMMSKMGFGSTWIRWIKECISTSSVSVLINGSPTKEFSMGHGIRQGDPLSPFLFLIVAEGLNLLLEEAKSKNMLSGIKIGNGDLDISNLKYADDTIIMAHATHTNVLAIKSVLCWFEIMSGLRVNFGKSSLTVFNMRSGWCSVASSLLKCKSVLLPFTYLRVPIGSSPCKAEFWKPVVNKHINKLAIWKCKSLSIGGRR